MSFIAAAAIMTGGSLISQSMGGQKSEKPQPMEPAWQRELRKRLSLTAEPKAMQRISRAGEPYTGEMVAPLSKYETTGLEQLGQYLKTPTPTEKPLYGMAKEEVSRTLGSDYYDPTEGKYYQALRTNVMREIQEAKDRIRAASSARDAFYGGGRIATEGEIEETGIGFLGQELGRLTEAERVRRLGTVPLATEMLGFEERMPLGRIAATQQFGALPRTWEQSVMDAEREEYLRQLTELGIPLDVATGLSTYQPPMYQPSYGPSGISQAMQGLSPLFMSAGMSGGFGNLFAGAGGGAGAIPGVDYMPPGMQMSPSGLPYIP